jgi:very-short-patch-repair endonuclease
LLSRTASSQRQSLLLAHAAEMRADPSPPEQLLWAALTNRKLGVSFRRQVPLAGYICDFLCASRRLVVEVDGSHHARRRAADARRDAVLARLGYRVLRLEARLVLGDLAGAVALVAQAL